MNYYSLENQTVDSVFLGDIVEIDYGDAREVVMKLVDSSRVVLGFRGKGEVYEVEYTPGEMVKTVRVWL